MNKNLILGYFYNVSSFEGIKIFIKSANNIKDRDFDVVLLDASDNNHDNALYKFAEENNTTVKKINKKLKSLYVDRFLAYKNYFLKTDYESVMLCDCTDIYFQSNPFLEINNSKLVLSSENILIKDAEWNYDIIKNVYGSQLADTFLEKPVINSGIIVGQKSQLEKICDLIVNEHLIYHNRCFNIELHIIYKFRNRRNNYIYIYYFCYLFLCRIIKNKEIFMRTIFTGKSINDTRG